MLDELTRTPDFDVEVTGFDLPDARVLIEEFLGHRQHGPDEEAFNLEAELAADRPLVTKSGDLIELGHHRLLCVDCTKPNDIRRLMQGERAILFETDPPYLVDYDGTNHPTARSKRRPGKDKNKNWTDSYAITWDDADANPDLYENFIRVAIEEAILPGAAWYCWHASRRQAMVEAAWEKHGAFVHQQIVWVKDRPILNRSWYLPTAPQQFRGELVHRHDTLPSGLQMRKEAARIEVVLHQFGTEEERSEIAEVREQVEPLAINEQLGAIRDRLPPEAVLILDADMASDTSRAADDIGDPICRTRTVARCRPCAVLGADALQY